MSDKEKELLAYAERQFKALAIWKRKATDGAAK